MADQIIKLFNPSGGMNQDDSLVTPTPKLEGNVSLFQHGDYRYAQNLRTSCARNDNGGDGEVIKSSRKVTRYVSLTQLFQDPNFLEGLTEWSQIVPVTAWVSFVPGIVLVGKFAGNPILYQSVPLGQTTVKYNVRYYTFFAGGEGLLSLQLVFLNGITEISYTEITNENSPEFTLITGEVSVPVGCDGIGIRAVMTGDATVGFTSLNYFQGFGVNSAVKPAGVNKTIGTLEDEEFQKVYEAVYNSEGNHVIREYDVTTETITELLKWPGLNFSEKSFVKMAKIDNYLAFTDRMNSPRLIDVNTISDVFLSLGADDFREFHISFVKWAAPCSPIVKYYDDGSTDNYDRLKDSLLQFSFRYKYKGNLRSAWSGYSAAVAANQNFDRTTGFYVFMPGLFFDGQGAEFDFFNSGDAKALAVIESVEIAFRTSEDSPWRLWKTISPLEATNPQLYTGDLSNAIIPVKDIAQPFDAVPLKAGVVEAIDNRFVFFDILDEMEPSMTPVITDVSTVSSPQSTNTSWNTRSTGQYTSITDTDDRNEIVNRTEAARRTFKGGGVYKMAIQYQNLSGRTSLGYTADNWIYYIPRDTGSDMSEEQHALAFKFDESFKPPKDAVSYRLLRSNCLNILKFISGTCNGITAIIDDPAEIINNLPKTDVEFQKALKEYIMNAGLITQQEFNKKLEVMDQNPIFGSTASFLRRNKVAGDVADSSRLFIDIRNWWSGSKKSADGEQNHPMNNLYYSWRPGDRVRFVGSPNADGSSPIFYDALITEFTSDALIVERPADLLWIPENGMTGTSASNQLFVIEVYTPKETTESDVIFWESGEWHPVLNAGTADRDWSKSDWTWTDNAGVTCDTYGDFKVFHNHPFYLGDCHLREKIFYNDYRASSTLGNSYTINTPMMSYDIDKTYDKWHHCNGRPALAYSVIPEERFKTTKSQFTGKAIEESFINNLNRMFEEDQFIYPSEFGRIRNAVNIQNQLVDSVGAILLVIGEHESFTIYVNRTTLEDLSGRSQVALSNKVLGSYNTLKGSHGTLNPESVTKIKSNAYWYDATDGAWIRYGRDGLTEISMYKMKTWFKELGDLIYSKYVTETPPNVVSGFDNFTDELMTYIHHADLPATFRGYTHYKGMVFSEYNLRWQQAHNYVPDRFAKIGNKTMVMSEGDIYLCEEGSDYLTIQGVKRDSRIEPVFNYDMPNMKVWDNIGVIATHKWWAEWIKSEFRGDKTIQLSEVYLESMVEQEDTYKADIMRDKNTLVVSQPYAEGNKMRSRAIRVLLTLDGTVVTRSLLHYAFVGFTGSPKTFNFE